MRTVHDGFPRLYIISYDATLDLQIPYETVKTYVKLARKALQQ